MKWKKLPTITLIYLFATTPINVIEEITLHLVSIFFIRTVLWARLQLQIRVYNCQVQQSIVMPVDQTITLQFVDLLEGRVISSSKNLQNWENTEGTDQYFIDMSMLAAKSKNPRH